MTNYLILINRDNPLKDSFVPENLVKVNDTEFLEKETYNHYLLLKESAKEAGYEIDVDSGYRSYDHQKRLYEEWLEKYGEDYTKAYCAPAGTSEHQSGLCFDVKLIRIDGNSENSKPTDPEIIWLHKNLYKYGFILRYPEGYEDITGYNYEHWHYRYIGVEHSTKMYNEDIKTFEEYYEKYLKDN
ncbi:MAG: M15 family metallopeptidase [Bacilli bacterium]|nr:M15 family metallopeptidase [Bacilli bacterium]